MPPGCRQPLTLNDVVCCYLGQRGRREEAYTRLRSIMREVQFEPPPALRQLAQITDFDLFVTHHVRSAARDRRSTSSATAVSRSRKSSPTRRTASPTCRSSAASCSAPVVYHLLGRLSASPTYVVSDEDMLEFICALQSEHLTPEKLFHELEHNHLLLIGSDFSNWLARLFLRMAKRKRLSDPRDVGEVFADDHTMQDERLVAFLQQVSVRTRVYGGAEAFVAELHARWTQRQRPGRCHAGPAARRSASCRRRARCPSNAIFISYAREDLPAVQRLKAALDAAGLTTWFDLDRLEGGDDYDRKIQRQHRALQLLRAGDFGGDAAPARGAISGANGATRSIARATSPMARVFILPVCIDDTPEADALVPEQFKAVHITRLPGGEPTPEFLRRLQDLFSGRRA